MKTCKFCGQPIQNRNTFCNNICQTNYQYKNYIDEWRQGLQTGLRGKDQFSMHIKRYMFEKYSNKCAICGWSEQNPYTKNVPLEIDHIDGNYTNNSEDNLILLCPNCHSLTPTYKGANLGKGRTSRRK